MLRPTGGGPRRPVAYTPRHGPPFSPPACLARAGEIGYDRVLFFSDAVFAIAITLLIVDLQVPDVPNLQSGTQLRESIPRMAGFALSFAAAGLAEADRQPPGTVTPPSRSKPVKPLERVTGQDGTRRG
jgi:hypothetical protein